VRIQGFPANSPYKHLVSRFSSRAGYRFGIIGDLMPRTCQPSPWAYGPPHVFGLELPLYAARPATYMTMDTLSGGQRQRALVAMALCQDTDYLLLDEPLNSLDMVFARDLMRSLRQIADQEGKTIVIVLHDINYASSFADRILAMAGGRLVANGPPQEIFRREILSESTASIFPSR
jgi:hypothetical protein